MNAPQDRDKRIALLIDADNSPAGKIDLILTELASFGVANVRRAYGNWKKDALKGWEKLLHEHAIRPMQQFDYSKGKNATDMVMVIEAMDLLYTDRPEAFGIVSSDADFTPLVMHLKAKGAQVFGFGAKKTPLPPALSARVVPERNRSPVGCPGALLAHIYAGGGALAPRNSGTLSGQLILSAPIGSGGPPTVGDFDKDGDLDAIVHAVRRDRGHEDLSLILRCCFDFDGG